MANAPKPIPSLRWWIGGLLFASTVINYIDRQTLSVLAPYLQLEYHWTNTDYAKLAIAFRLAYSVGQRFLQPYDVPFPARSGGIGELAGCDKSCVGMVSETRAGAGDRSVRQRFVHRRGSRPLDCSRDLFPMGMAACSCDSRRAGFSLADRVAMALSSTGVAHEDQPAGARNDRG